MIRTTSTAATAVVLTALVCACSGSGQSVTQPAPTPSTATPTRSTAPSTPPSKPVTRPMPPGPSCVPFDTGEGCLPVAPASRRVDLTRPVFSHPLRVTNALHPSSAIDQVIYGGQVGGKPFRTEFTRLPNARKTITWEGATLEAVSWQYLAFSDGRIEELAIDWFAQADDGGVWYLGEDVRDYQDGRVTSTEGTWVTGPNAPPALIMPATQRPGDVYRPENAPGVVFEEVTLKTVGRTVAGPSGPVAGAIVVSELHQDGSHEDKTFAPGYGEFSTGDPSGDLEAASLAVPTDSRPGRVPARLTSVSRAVRTAYDAVASGNWSRMAAPYRSLIAAWRTYHPGTGLLDRQMARDIATLGTAITRHQGPAARGAALRIAQNDLDLRLRYTPLPVIERARADLWRRQITVDTAAHDPAATAGDRAALTWTTQRLP